MRVRGLALALAVLPLAARAEAPIVEHQPSPCTVPDKPISLCATITDDNEVAKARLYFRKTGEKYWNVIDMAFGGISFCGTLPAPRAKTAALEYYIQGIDDTYEAQRTSTYELRVQGEDQCGFPPVESDRQKASAITVYATHKKQGKKIDDGAFNPAGVTFVPAPQ
jgi:hypothetical protein